MGMGAKWVVEHLNSWTILVYSVHFWDIHCREEGFNPHLNMYGDGPGVGTAQVFCICTSAPLYKGSSQRVTQGDFEVQKMTGRWYITAGLKPQVVRSRESSSSAQRNWMKSGSSNGLGKAYCFRKMDHTISI